MQDLKRRGQRTPLLIRFSDILAARVQGLVASFEGAIRDYGYGGRYRGVYPIKVNQQHQVVEELVRFGGPYGLGLEAGGARLEFGWRLDDIPGSFQVLFRLGPTF